MTPYLDALVTVIGATALLGAMWVMYLALWLVAPEMRP